jgi:hypothetical protein
MKIISNSNIIGRYCFHQSRRYHMSKAQDFATLLRDDPILDGLITVYVLEGGHLAVGHKKKTHKNRVSWAPDKLAKASYTDVMNKITRELLS